MLKSPDAKFRIEGAKRLAAENTKKSVEAIVHALALEQDGFAGREMGHCFKDVTEPEALLAAEKLIANPKKPGDFFAAVWALGGMAAGATATGDGIVQNALKKTHASEVSLRACALEAIGESARTEALQWLMPLLADIAPGVDKANTFETLSLLCAARKLGLLLPEDKRKPLLEALILVLDRSSDDRVDYFAAYALGKLTGKPSYTDANWWRNYLLNGETASDETGKTIARPTFFNAVAVGTRVVFVIDISGSMEWPADMDFRKNPVTGKGAANGPDYSHVKTKLDLAKVELIWTLAKLPEDMQFNIIVYESAHRFLDEKVEGLVPAKPENKTRFSNLVRALVPKGGTNIHGSLLRALRMTKKKPVEGDPSLDKKAMLEGVDTIFFLTDGSPSWSDDSTETGEIDPKWGAIGNGRYVKADVILADIARVNTFRKVVIHTIGVGKDHDKKMMEDLAAQNHGEYIDRS